MTDYRKGIGYMLIASFSFALTGACARALRDVVNPIELVLFRNLFGVIFILASLYRRPAVQQGGRPWLLIFRGVIGTAALYSFFYGISRIGLAVSITYQQSYPVFLALFAAFFMHESLSRREWAAVFLGFAGILLIFVPSVDMSSLSMKHHIIGLSNALMTGMAYLSIRGLSRWYDERAIILSFMLSGIVLPLISLTVGSFLDPGQFDFMIAPVDIPGWKHVPVILLLGFAALMGQIYLTKAFSYQKTGIIAAVGYSNIVFSIIFGLMLGDALPSGSGFTGIILIIASGMAISGTAKKNDNK